ARRAARSRAAGSERRPRLRPLGDLGVARSRGHAQRRRREGGAVRSLGGGQARFFGMPRDSFDWTLFLTAAALAVIGVINLYSATSVARSALSDIYIQQ